MNILKDEEILITYSYDGIVFHKMEDVESYKSKSKKLNTYKEKDSIIFDELIKEILKNDINRTNIKNMEYTIPFDTGLNGFSFKNNLLKLKPIYRHRHSRNILEYLNSINQNPNVKLKVSYGKEDVPSLVIRYTFDNNNVITPYGFKNASILNGILNLIKLKEREDSKK